LADRLADVYEVCGAVGRECQVQLAFGSSTKETKEWVSPGKPCSSITINHHQSTSHFETYGVRLADFVHIDSCLFGSLSHIRIEE